MAQFKVGQRVRIVRDFTGMCPEVIGVEGVILRPGSGSMWKGRPWDWIVGVGCDIHEPTTLPPNEVQAMSENLAPLLPPDSKADAFIASLKRLGKEPVNDVEKMEVAK